MPKKQKHKPNMEALVADDYRKDTKETEKSNNANIDLSVLKPLILQNMENLKGQRKSKKRKRNKEAAENGVDYSDEKVTDPEVHTVVDLTETDASDQIDTSALNSTFVSEDYSSDNCEDDVTPPEDDVTPPEDDVTTPEDQAYPSVFDDLNFKLISKEKAILIIKS